MTGFRIDTAPQDGRPMNTDRFLVLVLEATHDDHDRVAAIRDWVEGDWESALSGISTAKVGQMLETSEVRLEPAIAAQVATANAFEALGLSVADHAEEADRIEATIFAALLQALDVNQASNTVEDMEP